MVILPSAMYKLKMCSAATHCDLVDQLFSYAMALYGAVSFIFVLKRFYTLKYVLGHFNIYSQAHRLWLQRYQTFKYILFKAFILY